MRAELFAQVERPRRQFGDAGASTSGVAPQMTSEQPTPEPLTPEGVESTAAEQHPNESAIDFQETVSLRREPGLQAGQLATQSADTVAIAPAATEDAPGRESSDVPIQDAEPNPTALPSQGATREFASAIRRGVTRPARDDEEAPLGRRQRIQTSTPTAQSVAYETSQSVSAPQGEDIPPASARLPRPPARWRRSAHQDQASTSTTPSGGRDRTNPPPIVTPSNISGLPDGSHVIDIPDDIPDPAPSAPAAPTSALTNLLRGAGALAGHTVHQAVGTGVATYAREAVAIAVVYALRSQPGLALGLHTSTTLVNLATQYIRTRRLARDPDEAARGFHALTTEEWNAAPPEQQQAMRERQQRHSRAVVGLHVFGELVSLGFAARGFHLGDPIQTADALAQNVKNTFYAPFRDALQASFNMVGLRGNPDSPGVLDQQLSTAAFRFGFAQAVASSIAGTMMQAVAPGIAPSGGYIMGVPAESRAMMDAARSIMQANPLNSTPALLEAAARVAGVRAINNTWPEILDWFQLTRHEAQNTNTSQEWRPQLTGANPDPEARRDYSRVLDQSATRMATLHATTAIASLSNMVPHEGLRNMLGNLGVPIFIALAYKTIGQDWQAAGAVRGSVAARARAEAQARAQAQAEAEGASTSGG